MAFAFNEDYQKALTGGSWFWGSAGLFLTPWFPDYDSSTTVITNLPIWVRPPNLSTHLWHFSVFLGIGDTLGRYLATDTSRREKGLYTYGRLCVEIDISKGLPDQINLKIGDFHWTQTLDYESTASDVAIVIKRDISKTHALSSSAKRRISIANPNPRAGILVIPPHG